VDDKPLPISPVPRTPDPNQSTSSLLKTASLSAKRPADEDGSVTPANLKESLTNPSISSEQPRASPELTNAPGYRAAEAYVRPAPEAVAGTIKNYNFDLRKCQFSLTLQAPKVAEEDGPTVVFLPEYHFPKDACTVEVSSGKWEISSDDEEVVLIQRLRWWHGQGEQKLVINGLVRNHNVVEGVSEEDAGYYEQCNQGASNNCAVM